MLNLISAIWCRVVGHRYTEDVLPWWPSMLDGRMQLVTRRIHHATCRRCGQANPDAGKPDQLGELCCGCGALRGHEPCCSDEAIRVVYGRNDDTA